MLNKYNRMIERQSGNIVRPYRADGYVNMLNKYGTAKDTTEHYEYEYEPIVPDTELEGFYEGNGLFSKIIDAPAEEAIKHGFSIKGLVDAELEDFYTQALDDLDWEEKAITCLSWMRLFGGCIAVMLIDDGRGLDEPVDWDRAMSIDDIRVYDRSVVYPDYAALYIEDFGTNDPLRTRGSNLGKPEYYYIYSIYGSFRVHESRCLIFKNGELPEKAKNSIYRFWGIPEYIRLHRAVRDAEIAHGSSVKLLDRSIQAVYSMKGLSAELATEGGEDRVLRRLQTIDMARGLLNSITIDAEGEDYSFRQFSFSGVAEVIETTCNYLSALTNIPQTILFGRSPAGMNATGEGDLENWYNYVERIQKRVLKKNLRYLLSAIFRIGYNRGKVDEIPRLDIEFEPLWSMTEEQKVALDQARATVAQTKAATAATYIDLQVIDPSEVRRKLADSDEFDIETMLDDYTEEELEENAPKPNQEGMMPPGMMPQGGENALQMPSGEQQENVAQDAAEANSVGVLVVRDGKVLCGRRLHDDGRGLICGPGGKIEEGETSEEAAIREAQEEFGITPKNLISLGLGPDEGEFTPEIFLCTEYDGGVECDDDEMTAPVFASMDKLMDNKADLFEPFRNSLKIMMHKLYGSDPDTRPWLVKVIERVRKRYSDG